MKKIEITKEFNAPKLYDELLQKNLITPVQDNGMSRLQGNLLFVEDDSDIVAIQTVIDAHDPTPLPPQPTEMETLKEENELLKSKLQTTEHMARETSQAQQDLLELLLDMGVI